MNEHINRSIIKFKNPENPIKESEALLNFILSNSNDLIVIISKDMKILYMNKKAEDEFGTNQIGNLCFEVMMNKNIICESCCFNKINYNTISKFEALYTNLNSTEEKIFEFSNAFVLSFNGQPALIDIICDITDKKKIEHSFKDSEEIFRNFVDNLQFSVFLLEANKNIFDCNTAAELYLKRSKEDFIGENFFDLFPKSKEVIDSCDELIYNVINFELSEIVEFEFINDKANSSTIEAIFSSLKFRNEKYVQVLMKDITERKLVDNIIRGENERLRKIDDMKKKLTAQTSEEMKAPLNDMFDASQTLLDSYKDKLDQNAIKLLEMIKKGGKKSMNLVGRIVDISRIETEKIRLKRQIESLVKTITESVDETMIKIKKLNFTMNLDLAEDLYAEIDKHRIKQVIKDILLHIINNASKKSEISIYLQQNNDFAEIILKNESVNLNEKEKKTLFASRTKSNLKNFYLGLYFSKEIIDLHGGQILVESEGRNEGSKFILRLPIINWTDFLLQIYIFCNSGVLLYDYPFMEIEKKNDSLLISGGLVGMMTILKEVIQAERLIKIIDHGDRKIIFDFNTTNQIIFALIVKENLTIFHQKLLTLIEEFDNHYQILIENLEESCSVSENWESLGTLIEKHFA
ncbi:MAG: PAS domain S-box protein [Promethearchaeota archaeon]